MHEGDYLIGEHPKTHGYPGENETKTDREGPLAKFLIHSITNILIISERNKNVLVNMKEKARTFLPVPFRIIQLQTEHPLVKRDDSATHETSLSGESETFALRVRILAVIIGITLRESHRIRLILEPEFERIVILVPDSIREDVILRKAGIDLAARTLVQNGAFGDRISPALHPENDLEDMVNVDDVLLLKRIEDDSEIGDVDFTVRKGVVLNLVHGVYG